LSFGPRGKFRRFSVPLTNLPSCARRSGNIFPLPVPPLHETLGFSALFPDGIVAAYHDVESFMIEALFNQPNYLAAKKTLDAVELRQHAIANNIANLETPGYKRVDLAPTFQAELERACTAGDPQQLSSLKPTLATDATAVSNSPDGNTVNLEKELMQMNQNAMTHSLETQMVSGMLARMRLAITGKS
jgi:flagellar basal-body rod protein FlgB